MSEDSFTPENVALGKKPGVVTDPRTFKLKAFLPRKLPVAPTQSYVGKTEPIRMYSNDRYGCCVFSSQGHQIDVQEKSSRQVEIQLTDQDILSAYSAVTGFDPNRPETDNGTYMLDALNYRYRVGLGREADGSTHKIAAFAAIPAGTKFDKNLWKVASWMFGGVWFGAWLPWSAAEQLSQGKRWTVVDGPEGEPGSWGGHAMHALGYSEGSIVLATWGRRVRATWEWVAKYVDEAYVVISEDFFSKSGKTAARFNQEALQKALEELYG